MLNFCIILFTRRFWLSTKERACFIVHDDGEERRGKISVADYVVSVSRKLNDTQEFCNVTPSPLSLCRTSSWQRSTGTYRIVQDIVRAVYILASIRGVTESTRGIHWWMKNMVGYLWSARSQYPFQRSSFMSNLCRVNEIAWITLSHLCWIYTTCNKTD